MNDFQKYLSKSLLATVALLVGASPAWAQTPQLPQLGQAAAFSVLAGTNVTCTASMVAGDVGVSPGSAVPFTTTACTFGGATPPATNAAAVGARTDFLSAYAAILRLSTTCIQTPGNLTGLNLLPGTYCLDAVAKAGTLTLAGPSTGVWIFIVTGALTATDFSVVMADGGQGCNVFWAPSAAATLTRATFNGNILAGNAIGGSISLTGGTLVGRALANVAVTMTTAANVLGCGAMSSAMSGAIACKDKDHDGDDDKDKAKDKDKDRDHSSDARYPFGSNDKGDGKSGKSGKW
jgi:Ice-binding-like